MTWDHTGHWILHTRPESYMVCVVTGTRAEWIEARSLPDDPRARAALLDAARALVARRNAPEAQRRAGYYFR